MDFTQFNTSNASFTNAKKDLPFKKVNEINLGSIYRVNGIFSVEGKYGKRYFVSLEQDNDFFNFDLPVNTNEIAQTIIENKDAVDAINGGKCGIKITTYYSKKFNKENCASITWINTDFDYDLY